MQLTQNRPAGDYSIRSYAPNEIWVNETCYTGSIIVSPFDLIPNWPPQTIQAFAVQHLQAIIQLNPEIVLLGTGAQQYFLDPVQLTALITKRIGYEIMSTAAACRTFNLLAAEGRKVVAGLIIS